MILSMTGFGRGTAVLNGREITVELRSVNSILADYYKTPNQDYAARCQFRVHDTNLIDPTLTVKTREQAQAICDNWKKQNEDVYAYLMDLLLK